jgi:MraZ protein
MVEEGDMDTGTYANTIDDKGRFLVPIQKRSELEGKTFVLTLGIDKCLWLLDREKFEKLHERILGTAEHQMNKENTILLRRLVAPAQEISMDKSGRIAIPATLRKFAGIVIKEEALLIKFRPWFEIWNSNEYEKWMLDVRDDVAPAANDLGIYSELM